MIKNGLIQSIYIHVITDEKEKEAKILEAKKFFIELASENGYEENVDFLSEEEEWKNNCGFEIIMKYSSPLEEQLKELKGE